MHSPGLGEMVSRTESFKAPLLSPSSGVLMPMTFQGAEDGPHKAMDLTLTLILKRI